MLKVFLGPDAGKARAALGAAVAEFRAANPGALVTRFDVDHCDTSEIGGALGAASLFGGSSCVVLDMLAERVEGEEILKDMLPLAVDSTNTVFILEGAPKKELKEALDKAVSKGNIQAFAKAEKKDDGAVFALGDALAGKDKRAFWDLLIRLRRDGHAAEELHGTLWWAGKSLYIAKVSSRADAEAAGVKGYSYTKFSGFAQKWSKEELDNLIDRLKDIVHERSEERGGDLDLLLEKFALSL